MGIRHDALDNRIEEGFIEPAVQVYPKISFHFEKVIVPYCCKDVSELVSFILGIKRSCWKRSEEIVEFGVQREDETLFVRGNPFQLYFS